MNIIFRRATLIILWCSLQCLLVWGKTLETGRVFKTGPLLFLKIYWGLIDPLYPTKCSSYGYFLSTNLRFGWPLKGFIIRIWPSSFILNGYWKTLKVPVSYRIGFTACWYLRKRASSVCHEGQSIASILVLSCYNREWISFYER